MGLPVVASRLLTGVTDVTLDEITGLLVPPDDPNALAAAFARLLSDRESARRFGVAGRERALRLFKMVAFEDRFSRLFNAVLMGQPFDELMMPFL
jgi:glycosyltransferase involved in cell wall biosynthesis